MSFSSTKKAIQDLEWLKEKVLAFESEREGILTSIEDRISVLEARVDALADRLEKMLLATHTITISLSATAPWTNFSGSVTVTATFTDSASHTCTRAQCFIDATKIGELTASPWSFTVNTKQFSNGDHTLKIIMFCSGGYSKEQSQSITINNTIPLGGTGTSATQTGSGSSTPEAPQPYGGKVLFSNVNPPNGAEIKSLYSNWSFVITGRAYSDVGHIIKSVSVSGDGSLKTLSDDGFFSIVGSFYGKEPDNMGYAKCYIRITATDSAGVTGTLSLVYKYYLGVWA